MSSTAATRAEQIDVRTRFLARTQAELRDPRMVMGSGLLHLGLGAIPLLPGGASIVGVPFSLTALWATLYVAISCMSFIVFRRSGPTSRSYTFWNTVETAFWLYSVIGLAAASRSLASPWLLLLFLAFIFLGAAEPLINVWNIAVIALTPGVAFAGYARLGAAAASTAFALVALGWVAWFMVARGVARMLEEQAKREVLQRRVGELERELERRRIARDLHDSIGSALALVGMSGDLIERHVDAPDELRRISAALRETSRDGLGDLRGLLDAMAPADPGLAGVAESLQRAARHLETTASVTVDVSGTAPAALPASVRLALVRVFQEATNNAIRHGHAHHIDARLGATGGNITLSISDDGAGFDSAATKEGRGLLGMRTRATELGGSLAIDALPGRGTCITLALPLTAAKRSV